MEENKIAFTREQVQTIDGFVSELAQNAAYGGIEPYVHSGMAYAANRYAHKMDDNKNMQYAINAIAAGALPPHSALMHSAVGIFSEENGPLSSEDKSVFHGFLDQVKYLQGVGMSPAETANRVSEMGGNTIADLAKYERAGKDINNLRILVAGVITGATAGDPHVAMRHRQMFADLMQHHAQ